jgi:DNA-binding MarR family transcriptional regulator
MRIESFLRQSPVFQASRIARRMEAALNAILQSENLTFFESLVLAAIFFERKTAVRPSNLAETFQTTRGNVSHCISSLEAKGLVGRSIDREDARGLQIVLTSTGRKRAVRIVGILDKMQTRFEDGIGVARLQQMMGSMTDVEDLCARLVESTRKR